MRSLLVSLVLVGLMLTGSAQAAPEDFVQKIADRGIAFWSDATLGEAERQTKWRSLLKSTFDLASIGRFTMGPSWRSATPAQQREFLKLFEGMIVRSYAQRFGSYQGQDIKVMSSRAISDKDSLVSSVITSPGSPDVAVDWRVRTKGGSMKIVDVLVEGVSMSQTHRSEFAAAIQQKGGDVNAFLDELRRTGAQ